MLPLMLAYVLLHATIHTRVSQISMGQEKHSKGQYFKFQVKFCLISKTVFT